MNASIMGVPSMAGTANDTVVTSTSTSGTITVPIS
jgi:hypothetical protein